jgi:hypothetical protein
MQCKSGGKKHGNKKVLKIHSIAKTKCKNLRWKHNKKLRMKTQQEWTYVHKHNTHSVNVLHSKSMYILVKTKNKVYNTYKVWNTWRWDGLGHEPYVVCDVIDLYICYASFLSRVYTSFVELYIAHGYSRYNAIDINPFAIHVIILKFVTIKKFSIIIQHYFDVGLLGFLLLDSSIQVRRSTTCLSTPNCFLVRCHIACTLPTHHGLIWRLTCSKLTCT